MTRIGTAPINLSCLVLCLLGLISCDTGDKKAESKAPILPIYEKIAFNALPNWQTTDIAGALLAFQSSCTRLSLHTTDTYGRMPKEIWHKLCHKIDTLEAHNDSQLKIFIEQNFVPVKVSFKKPTKGQLTGYYIPILKGSKTKAGPYQTPLYERPYDLVTISDLGLFRPESYMIGKRIAGYINQGKIEPYLTRKEIEQGALGERIKPLYYVDSLVDAFFLHVQGSGTIQLPDGQLVKIGYHGTNGRHYTSIGKILLQQGELQKGKVSMQSIKAWLHDNPSKVNDLLWQNESFVFFRELGDKGIIGTMAVPLTPMHSVAVDSRFTPMGMPVFINSTHPLTNKPFSTLAIAQDTGGAIRGVNRMDLFIGIGEKAGNIAGVMNQAFSYVIFLPKGQTLESLEAKKT